jgi:hypothetical protein
MTYLIAFKQPDINAIISDARGTWTRLGQAARGDNNALKTGLLFPGCIYGIVGSADCANELIVGFKESLGAERARQVLWERFREVANAQSYSQASADQFKLLLSSRHAGPPAFYVLDPARSNPVAPIETNAPYAIATLGSGKVALDKYVAEKARLDLEELRSYLACEKQLPIEPIHEISPYFFCLWLSELSLTAEKAFLEAEHVGGVFHFVYQTRDLEATQKPAFYVFSSADRAARAIYSWWYRVAYARGGLYVEYGEPPGQRSAPPNIEEHLLFSSAASPGIESLDMNTLYGQVKRDVSAQPFWFFSGLGHTDPRERGSHFFNVSTDGRREDLFGEDGQLTAGIRQVIESGFTEHDLYRHAGRVCAVEPVESEPDRVGYREE